MTSLEHGLRQALHGGILKGVRAEVYVAADGERWNYPSRLALDWNDLTLIFKGGPEGERLVLDTEPLSAADMGESGKVIVEDWSSRAIASRLTGSRLIGAALLVSHGVEIGAQLRFEKDDIEILNNGDELWVASQLSPALLSDVVPRLISPN